MQQLLLLLIVLCGLTAMKLPGRHCPKVPKIHRMSCLMGNEVLYSIPFSKDKPSHLFREMNKSAIEAKLSRLDIANTLDSLNYVQLVVQLNRTIECPALVLDNSMEKNSYRTKTDIFSRYRADRKLLCPISVYEDLWLWCEFPFLFLWSCVEGNSATYHEEALLVLQDYDDQFKTKRTQEEVRAVAKKFVSADLLALIDFDHHIELHNGSSEMYTCPESDRVLNMTALVLILGLLAAVIGSCCYILKSEGE